MEPNFTPPMKDFQNLNLEKLADAKISYKVEFGRFGPSRKVTVTVGEESFKGNFKELLSRFGDLTKEMDTPETRAIMEKLSKALSQGDQAVQTLTSGQKANLKVRQIVGNLFYSAHNKKLMDLEQKINTPINDTFKSHLTNFSKFLKSSGKEGSRSGSVLEFAKSIFPILQNPSKKYEAGEALSQIRGWLGHNRVEKFYDFIKDSKYNIPQTQTLLASLNKSSPALVFLLIEILDCDLEEGKPSPFALEKELAMRALGFKESVKSEPKINLEEKSKDPLIAVVAEGEEDHSTEQIQKDARLIIKELLKQGISWDSTKGDIRNFSFEEVIAMPLESLTSLIKKTIPNANEKYINEVVSELEHGLIRSQNMLNDFKSTNAAPKTPLTSEIQKFTPHSPIEEIQTQAILPKGVNKYLGNLACAYLNRTLEGKFPPDFQWDSKSKSITLNFVLELNDIGEAEADTKQKLQSSLEEFNPDLVKISGTKRGLPENLSAVECTISDPQFIATLAKKGTSIWETKNSTNAPIKLSPETLTNASKFLKDTSGYAWDISGEHLTLELEVEADSWNTANQLVKKDLEDLGIPLVTVSSTSRGNEPGKVTTTCVIDNPLVLARLSDLSGPKIEVRKEDQTLDLEKSIGATLLVLIPEGIRKAEFKNSTALPSVSLSQEGISIKFNENMEAKNYINSAQDLTQVEAHEIKESPWIAEIKIPNDKVEEFLKTTLLLSDDFTKTVKQQMVSVKEPVVKEPVKEQIHEPVDYKPGVSDNLNPLEKKEKELKEAEIAFSNEGKAISALTTYSNLLILKQSKGKLPLKLAKDLDEAEKNLPIDTPITSDQEFLKSSDQYIKQHITLQKKHVSTIKTIREELKALKKSSLEDLSKPTEIKPLETPIEVDEGPKTPMSEKTKERFLEIFAANLPLIFGVPWNPKKHDPLTAGVKTEEQVKNFETNRKALVDLMRDNNLKLVYEEKELPAIITSLCRKSFDMNKLNFEVKTSKKK